MTFKRLFFCCVLLLVALDACGVGSGKRGDATPWPSPTPTPTPISTAGLPLAPTPLPKQTSDPVLVSSATRDGLCADSRVVDAKSINGRIYVGCYSGTVLRVSARMRVLRRRTVSMNGPYIFAASPRAIAVNGFGDGATLVNRLTFLDARTLSPIIQDALTDSTFLGIIGMRAYIDDWCCNGRPDIYEPATIYSISLMDGSISQPVDLKPDPRAHPEESQPLGQGERNYLIGTNLYVPIDQITYRYDVLHLNRPPARMRTLDHPHSRRKNVIARSHESSAASAT